MPYYGFMFTIVESSLFSRLVFDYLSEEEYEGLKLFLALNPESGDVIPGSGGLRKLRWIRTGTGRRPGDHLSPDCSGRNRPFDALCQIASRQHPSPYRQATEGGV